MSALEGWARAWLVEPKYVTVFKPTMDVVRHYFSFPFEFRTSSFILSHQELIGEGLPMYYISSFGFISDLKSYSSKSLITGEGLPLHRSCCALLHRARCQPCLVTWLRANRLLSH